MKNIWLSGLLLLAALLPSAAAADTSGFPFTYLVHDNGEVIVTDGFQEIVRVFPWIFTGNWVKHHWKGAFLFKAGNSTGKDQGSCTVLVNEVPVDMEYKIECMDNGLRFHYHLEPREALQVSAVEIYCRFPYPDWQGTSFEFNDKGGFIPIDAWKETAPESAWLIRQADSASLSLGPSRYHGGLTAQMNPENLYVLLADDRWYDPKLSIVLSHNDTPGFGANPPPNWTWEKGQAKDFDFALTFNRSMVCPPATSLTPRPSATPTPTPNFSFLTPNFSFASAMTPTPLLAPVPTPHSSLLTPHFFPLPTPRPKAIPTFDFSFLTPNFFSSFTPTPGHLLLTTRLPFSPTPTLTPYPASTPKVSHLKHRLIPTPTQPLPIIPNSSFPVFLHPIPPTPTPVFTSYSTPDFSLLAPNLSFSPTPVWLSLLDKRQTVEFSDPPANIYVVFADGPGQYRADVTDRDGKKLEVIFNRKIMSQTDIWLEWDCMDGKGMPVPPGQYFVVIYKDGKALKSLSVVRIPQKP